MTRKFTHALSLFLLCILVPISTFAQPVTTPQKIRCGLSPILFFLQTPTYCYTSSAYTRPIISQGKVIATHIVVPTSTTPTSTSVAPVPTIPPSDTTPSYPSSSYVTHLVDTLLTTRLRDIYDRLNAQPVYTSAQPISYNALQQQADAITHSSSRALDDILTNGSQNLNSQTVSVSGLASFMGNVGIGTTTPDARLTVIGAASSHDLFTIASSSQDRLFTVAANGNVGIGTSTPGYTLDVAGVSNLNGLHVSGGYIGGTDSTSQLAFYSGADYSQGAYFNVFGNDAGNDSQKGNIEFVTPSKFVMYGYSTAPGYSQWKQRFVVSQDGRAMIGGRLNWWDTQVSDSDMIGALTLTSQDTTKPGLVVIPQYNQTADLLDIYTGTGFFGNLGQKGLVFTASGNLGIGTSTPGSSLSVAGNAYLTGNVVATSFTSETSLGNGAKLETYNDSGFPAGRLTLNGVFSTDTWDENGITMFNHAWPSNKFLQATDNSGTGSVFFAANNGSLSLGTTGTNKNILLLPTGNVGIGTTTPTLGPLVMASGAYVTSGGTWTNASDRNLKENFTEVDGQDILNKIAELPITQWNYKSESATTTHIGPMAQDFFRIFNLGGSDTSISTIDPSGLALVGIQTLNANLNAILTASTTIFSSSSLATTSSSLTFASQFFASIGEWLGSATNSLTKIFAKEVTSEKLCVSDSQGKTCITRAELDALLQNAHTVTQPSTPTPPPTTPNPVVEETPTSTPTTTPEVTPVSVPVETPVVSEPTPDPAPTEFVSPEPVTN